MASEVGSLSVNLLCNTDELVEWANEVKVLAIEVEAAVARLRWRLDLRPTIKIEPEAYKPASTRPRED